MLARGNSAAVLSPTCAQDPASIHSYFEGQRIKSHDNMIPLEAYTKYGRRFNTENVNGNGAFRRNGRKCLTRLKSAPELYKSELPPIGETRRSTYSGEFSERKHRPLTPLVVNTNRKQSSKSLPKNYRINLDLVPLVEVGTGIGNLSINRQRQASQSSSDSCFSSSTPSPKLNSKSISPRPPSELKDVDHFERSFGFQKRTNSAESLEEVCSDSEDVDGKDTMIMRWLQTVEKSQETAVVTGELLPSIKEGKLA